jgi:hypothetical protein
MLMEGWRWAAEHLPDKLRALSSYPSAAKNQEKLLEIPDVFEVGLHKKCLPGDCNYHFLYSLK